MMIVLLRWTIHYYEDNETVNDTNSRTYALLNRPLPSAFPLITGSPDALTWVAIPSGEDLTLSEIVDTEWFLVLTAVAEGCWEYTE